jgi:hypothetical protein
MMLFLSIAGTAKSLQIADIVTTTLGERDDVVDLKIDYGIGFATALTLKFIAIEHVGSDNCGNRNAGSFRHNYDAGAIGIHPC